MGDFGNVMGYRYTCSYEIVRRLPNRVFVVRQKGGDVGSDEDEVDPDWNVDQRISVMGSLDKGLKLLADIEGIITELIPASRKDLNTIHIEMQTFTIKKNRGDNDSRESDEGRVEEVPHRFLGLDVFNKEA